MASKESLRVHKNLSNFCVLWILGFLRLVLAITSSDNDSEIMNLLKKLNKPHVKSIRSPDGDIIDCVPIHLQPAFDNPLLKNHTIQMRPSSYPKDLSRNFSSSEQSFTQLWRTKGSCPKGTIPIRRTKMEDLLRAKSLQRFGRKTPHAIPSSKSPASSQTNGESREYAIRYVEQGYFYGARALIGIWNPMVKEADEFSLAQTWLSAGEEHVDLNTIEVGWQVYYDLYGDNKTRLFGFWTRDAYKTTGCYNLACPGFVQIVGAVALGSVVAPISTHRGKQYHIATHIFKDPKKNDWWLKVGEKLIGYWPASLFTHLQDSAESVDWGGEVVNRAVNGKHTTTQMGSGEFSRTKSAFFMNLQVVDESNMLRTPVDLITKVTHPDCYDLTALSSDDWGEFFYYGGPGRNPKCH